MILYKENLAEAFHIIVKKIHQINLKQKQLKKVLN